MFHQLMVMEAMRLSLLEHEEQQRKEAEEKKKQAAASAETEPTPSTQPASGPGPSTLEAHPINQASTPINLSWSPASSPPISSSLSHASRTPQQESPSAKRNSWRLSRSRTPSPSPPTNPASAFQSLNDTATWRRRTSNPPPFSTLSAALSASSTVSAVLGSAGPAPNAAPNLNGDASVHAENGTAASASIPAITTAGNTVPRRSDDTSAMEGPFQQPGSLEQPVRASRDSPASSMFSTDTSAQAGFSYDYLPSSPDSILARDPLLRPETQSGTPKEASPTGEEPRDYIR